MSSLRTRFDYVRGVSGLGPRCGCGGKSELHVGYGSAANPQIFLCVRCVTEAVELLFEARPEKQSFWAGDEDRDEPYVDPRGSDA